LNRVTAAPNSKEKIVIAGFEPERARGVYNADKLNPPIDNGKSHSSPTE
jgi:hypothetical protein